MINWPNNIYIVDKYSVLLKNPGNSKRLDYVFKLVSKKVTKTDIDCFLGMRRIYNVQDITQSSFSYNGYIDVFEKCTQIIVKPREFMIKGNNPIYFDALNKKDSNIDLNKVAIYNLVAKNVENPMNLRFKQKKQKTIQTNRNLIKDCKLIKKLTKDFIYLDDKYILQLIKNDLKNKIDEKELERKMIRLQ